MSNWLHTDPNPSPSFWEGVMEQKDRLLGFIQTRVPTWEDAEDILQDVYVQLVVREPETELENTGAWLYSVARNKIADLFRKKKPESFSKQAEDWFWDLLMDEDEDPEHLMYRANFQAELKEALDELPAEQKAVFVMHELEGLSFKEIEAKTGVGQNTLISRKHYAVKFLRERFENRYAEWFE